MQFNFLLSLYGVTVRINNTITRIIYMLLLERAFLLACGRALEIVEPALPSSPQAFAPLRR